MSLIQIGKSDIGKKAIQVAISKVQLIQGENLKIELSGKTLRVISPFTQNYSTSKKRSELVDLFYETL